LIKEAQENGKKSEDLEPRKKKTFKHNRQIRPKNQQTNRKTKKAVIKNP